MTITSKDVLFYQAQDNTDNEEGGGYRSPVLIQDGVMNNLFNDISRLDAIGGDLNMRKVIRVVNTDDRSLYQGSHAIIRKNPEDPKVGAIIIHDPDPFSTRKDIVELLESYTTPAAKTTYYLEGSYTAGMRVLSFVQLNTIQSAPYIGQVLAIADNINGVTEYVKIKTTTKTKAYGFSGGVTFSGGRVTCEITEPLTIDLEGFDFTQDAINSGRTEVRTTTSNDNLDFFGTTLLAEDVTTGDVNIKVDTTKVPLMPTDSIRDTIVSQTFVESVTSFKELGGIAAKNTSTINAGQTINVGYPILAGSITSDGGHIDDEGSLVIASSGQVVGSINYATGTISVTNSITSPLEYKVGIVTEDSNTGYTDEYLVTESNQSTLINFTTSKQCDNAGYVQYRSAGIWYKAYIGDNGVINDDFISGSIVPVGATDASEVTLNMTELPDVNSRVIITYASENGVEDLATQNNIVNTVLRIDLPDNNINPTGFTISVDTNNGAIDFVYDDSLKRPYNATYSGTRFLVDWANGVVHMMSVDVDMNMPTTSYSNPFTFSYYVNQDTITYTTVNTPAFDQEDVGVYDLNLTAYTSNAFEISLQVIEGHHEIGDIDLSNTKEVIIRGGDDYAQGTGIGKAAGYIGDGGISPYLNYDNSTRNIYTQLVNGLRTVSVARVNYLKTATVNDDNTGLTLKTIVRDFDNVGVNLIVSLPWLKLAVSEFSYESELISVVGSKVYNDGAQIGLHDVNNHFCRFPYITSDNFTELTPNTLALYVTDNELVGESVFVVGNGEIKQNTFTVRFITQDGTIVTANADGNGSINVVGVVTGALVHDKATVSLTFVEPIDITTLTFSAQSETSSSSSSTVTGLSSVRMPADGNVSIFRAGYYVVLFDELTTDIGTPSAGETVQLSRDKQAYIEVIDVNGERVNPDAYTADRLNGSVTFATPLSLVNVRNEPLTAPYSIVDRVEDGALIRNVLSDGTLQLSAEVTRDYVAGVARVASCLVWGDSVARLYNIFSQTTTGNPMWSDSMNGTATTAQYNNATYPMQVYNADAISGRYMLQFKTTTTVDVIHETMGIIAANVSISTADVAPINPVTGNPIFIAYKEGFGAGWSVGNIIRFNIEAMDDSLWVLRPVQSGALNESADFIELEARGDSK